MVLALTKRTARNCINVSDMSSLDMVVQLILCCERNTTQLTGQGLLSVFILNVDVQMKFGVSGKTTI